MDGDRGGQANEAGTEAWAAPRPSWQQQRLLVQGREPVQAASAELEPWLHS